MKEAIASRLMALRSEMKASGVDAVIIPQTDPHQGEYIADHWQVRRWLSGFTGSAGSLVVTADKALLWTDSRYFLQAEAQLSGTEIQLMKDGLPETPSILSYLTSTLHKGQTVGIDGALFSIAETASMRKTLDRAGLRLDNHFVPADKIWTDRPDLPSDPVFIHDVKYAGETAESKISRVLAEAALQGATSLFISALDEIAWTLNIRSNDVSDNPVVTSFLYLAPKGSSLFVKVEKIGAEVAAHL